MTTVLIVDDDPEMRSLYRLVLRREGLDVIEAASGPEALALIQRNTPSLVLLDIMMPGMDGYEVCRRLRADPKTAQLPVLMFSAKASSAARRDGLLVGADDFMNKSVGPRALVNRIRSLLASSWSSADSLSLPATNL